MTNTTNNHQPVLSFQEVKKSFKVGTQNLDVIKGVSFDVLPGEFVIIFGPSGCGKSTMLNMLLGLEEPTQGVITFLGKNLYDTTDDERAEIRKRQIGMVYQQSNWVKALNVLENVYFPLTLRGMSLQEREEKGRTALHQVGMDSVEHQHPTELSGGQQQRASLARALIAQPSLIVADEPTGNLDSKAGEEIMNLFQELHSQGRTVIMVTHDLEYLKYASKAVNVSDGLIIGTYMKNDPRLAALSVSKRGSIVTDATKESATKSENSQGTQL